MKRLIAITVMFLLLLTAAVLLFRNQQNVSYAMHFPDMLPVL